MIHLTFYPTFTRWRRVAPLPVGLALSACGPLHLVAPVTDEADHVVEVEAVAHRATVYGTARVSAADGCGGRGDSVLSELAHGGVRQRVSLLRVAVHRKQRRIYPSFTPTDCHSQAA